MQMLIIGSGGREHALAWKVAQNPDVAAVYVAPGNAGTATTSKTHNVAIDVLDIPALIQFAQDHAIALTIVGPEAPLEAGIVDAFQAAGLRCFGPSQAAAQLESSKAFCKAFLQNNQIPTAQFALFSEAAEAIAYLDQHPFPVVIKASGLAAGKGVIIAQNMAEATAAVHSMLTDQHFGTAGQQIVIEDYLDGEELSFIVMVDGNNILPLASSQDHKRRDAGDQGPNTGGMGAYSPAALMSEACHQRIMTTIIEPTVNALQQAGTPYTGFLYAGLMIMPNGEPKVLEYNCRLGDPETQPLLVRLQSDLVSLCQLAVDGALDTAPSLSWDPRPALCVVLAAGGYPGPIEKGQTIAGLDQAAALELGQIFHAGTTLIDGTICTNGGRVLSVVALGEDIADAQQAAYQMAEKIDWPGRFYREDIGSKALITA